jgi:HK97 family phage portal protein
LEKTLAILGNIFGNFGSSRFVRSNGNVLLNSPDGWMSNQTNNQFWWVDSSLETLQPSGGLSDVALSLPAASRAASLIVDTISGLPINLRRGLETLETPNWMEDPQLIRPDARIMSTVQPGRLNKMEFFGQWIFSALIHGNGFIYIDEREVNGQPKAGSLYILHPELVDYVPGTGYFVRDPQSAEWEYIPDGKLIHLRNFGELDERKFGTGVIRRHAASFLTATEMRNYTSGVYRSGIPNGILKVSNPNLTSEQAAELKAKWLENHGDKRSIAVLNSSTEFQPLSISPVDAQLLQMSQMSINDIALSFGLDPYMLGGSSDSNTYANVESRNIAFVQNALLPWIRRIEETLNAETSRGTFVKINLTALLRADTATRTQAYATGLDKGWLTINEVRAFEDLPPLPENNEVPNV